MNLKRVTQKQTNMKLKVTGQWEYLGTSSPGPSHYHWTHRGWCQLLRSQRWRWGCCCHHTPCLWSHGAPGGEVKDKSRLGYRVVTRQHWSGSNWASQVAFIWRLVDVLFRLKDWVFFVENMMCTSFKQHNWSQITYLLSLVLLLCFRNTIRHWRHKSYRNVCVYLSLCVCVFV